MHAILLLYIYFFFSSTFLSFSLSENWKKNTPAQYVLMHTRFKCFSVLPVFALFSRCSCYFIYFLFKRKTCFHDFFYLPNLMTSNLDSADTMGVEADMRTLALYLG